MWWLSDFRKKIVSKPQVACFDILANISKFLTNECEIPPLSE